jgi:glutathione S-transferase
MPVFFEGVTTVAEEKVTAVKEALETLDGYLDGNDWVAGSNVTLADLAFLASVSTMAVGFYDKHLLYLE